MKFDRARKTAMDDEAARGRTLKLIGAYQTLMGQRRWDEWTQLWAEDAVLEFPFAPKGRRSVYRGRAEILAYMQAALGRIAIDATDGLRVFPMLDPEIAAVEFAVRGRATTTGRPYNQRYLIIFETTDGKIRHYREYWNPLVSMDAFGEGWAAAFGSPEAGE
jgi:ketosteroid isomerase-like protein